MVRLMFLFFFQLQKKYMDLIKKIQMIIEVCRVKSEISPT